MWLVISSHTCCSLVIAEDVSSFTQPLQCRHVHHESFVTCNEGLESGVKVRKITDPIVGVFWPPSQIQAGRKSSWLVVGHFGPLLIAYFGMRADIGENLSVAFKA